MNSLILDRLPNFAQTIRAMMDIVITNIVLVGQIPAPTFGEKDRVAFFLDRLAGFQVDECTMDAFGNPIGILRGSDRGKPPIFVVAHMDTPFGSDVDHHFTVKQNTVSGPGLLDNSLSVGVLLSLPEILRRLGLQFASDIVLAGVVQSIGRGNLRGIRHLIKTWSTPIRAAICLESGELGRLNYYSDGMIRCEVVCHVEPGNGRAPRFRPNAILVLNEVINQILELRLPLKPRSKIIFGTIQGGLKHGEIALEATLGMEIHSDSDDMVKRLYGDIKDIVVGIRHEYAVELTTQAISTMRAARLKYNHPLVKSAVTIMKKLGVTPYSEPSESELPVFLSRGIPALMLGISHGDGYQQVDASMQINPMFKGIAQIIGILLAIDGGVCDDTAVD